MPPYTNNNTLNMKRIKFYRKEFYGATLEYLHPDNGADINDSILYLVHKRTINPLIRENFLVASQGAIQWKETIAPTLTH